ncbi:flavin-containing monooxygenase [Sphingobium tyrosinilyticum]|uniref:NAD(P)-binding domain-containing protein n=1 Tax=Sphingobium tyrosinilyticum TaxID=2715436 RepID=A0ABV9EUK3_9SPHN
MTVALTEDQKLPLAEDQALRDALAAADLPTLLMTYVHLSRDMALLDKFQPHVHALSSGKQTAVPDDLAAELREKMRALLTSPNEADLTIPEPALLQRIMSVGMGEPVSKEFIPLLLEQSGLGPQHDRSHRPARQQIPQGFKVLIIGAGISGLAAAIKLKEGGYDFEVIEKNSEVGGTWWVARYPGAGVDTPSHFYSYSFALNPEWSTYRPRGREMLDYLIRASHSYGVRDHIHFETEVLGMRWIEDEQVWEVELNDKHGGKSTVRANAVINAHGRLSRWVWPKIEGLKDFEGPLVHTAEWDPDLDLKGKRVAMVGTGASAAQCGPAIVDEVEHLTVFMRSGHWVVPSEWAAAKVPEGVQWAMRHIPFYLAWFRFGIYWTGSDGLYSNLIKDPEWPAESPSVSLVNERLRKFCMSNLEAKLGDRPDLMEKLTPDCPVFSKRIVMDTNWLTMFRRDNVTLETAGIERVLPGAIRTADGTEHRVDAIILATGYDVARMAGWLDIIGRDGVNLRELWGDEDPVGYFGLMVPGFPNYFHIMGPNAGPNHGAGVNLMAEAQVHYILECLDHLVETGASAMEPTEDANATFNDRVQGQMPKMIWTHPKANSYYKNSKGRVIGSWPFRLLDYWNESREPKLDDFVIHEKATAEETAA